MKARSRSRSPIPMSQAASRDNAMSVAAISSERIETEDNAWTRRLVFFLRIMAVISVAKGLYHWAQVTGFIGGEEDAFENQPMAWQTATVYFAVIELVAAVGCCGVADHRGVDGGDRTDVSGNLWRQPDGGGDGSRDAGGVSRARMDGGARTSSIGDRNSSRMIRQSVSGLAVRSCANKKIERDDDSKNSHPALWRANIGG